MLIIQIFVQVEVFDNKRKSSNVNFTKLHQINQLIDLLWIIRTTYFIHITYYLLLFHKVCCINLQWTSIMSEATLGFRVKVTKNAANTFWLHEAYHLQLIWVYAVLKIFYYFQRFIYFIWKSMFREREIFHLLAHSPLTELARG